MGHGDWHIIQCLWFIKAYHGKCQNSIIYFNNLNVSSQSIATMILNGSAFDVIDTPLYSWFMKGDAGVLKWKSGNVNWLQHKKHSLYPKPPAYGLDVKDTIFSSKNGTQCGRASHGSRDLLEAVISARTARKWKCIFFFLSHNTIFHILPIHLSNLTFTFLI